MIASNHLNPKICLTDFESGVIQTVIEELTGIQVKGCFFHLKQAIHRWVANHSYKILYFNNNNFRIWVNKLGSLALIPLDRLDEGWNHIKTQKIEHVNLNPIIKYFEDTWLKGIDQFKPEIWNHFEFIGPRSNGDMEGMNRQISMLL